MSAEQVWLYAGGAAAAVLLGMASTGIAAIGLVLLGMLRPGALQGHAEELLIAGGSAVGLFILWRFLP